MAKRKPTRLLIDADHIIYAASCALQIDTDWGEGIETRFEDRDQACDTVVNYIDKLVDDFGAEEWLLAVSNSSTTFRDQLYPEYKANRSEAARPTMLNWLRRWVIEELDGKALPNLEADDVVGISATHPKWRDWRQVIVSEDKDLRQIPGEIFSPKREELLKVSPEEAELHFYCQALAGDTVDNFPGCPGIGMIGARRLLANNTGIVAYPHVFKRGPRKGLEEIRWAKSYDMDTPWEAILTHYERAGLDEDYALLMARMAFILRYDYYDFKEGEVKLWTPE